MPHSEAILAYFGPETTFPVMSFLAGAIGFFLMLGKSSTRFVRQRLRAMFRQS